MHDPRITADEDSLFAFMRDGVIKAIETAPLPTPTWRCRVNTADDPVQRSFESTISALDAFLKAHVYIMTKKLEGKEIYTWPVRKTRRQLGLE